MKPVRRDTPIGWIGTGIMGSAMCAHLIDAGYQATVYSRTRERAKSLLAKGAQWASSPVDVAAAADVVFTMVGTPADVRDVVLGANGVLGGARPGTVIVDMTTSEPALAEEVYAAAEKVDVASIDAPVSGGDVGARNATLSIMVGGTDDAVGRVWPLFDLMGTSVLHQGGPGAGQHTKIVNQILIASGVIAVSEALIYARRARLDTERVLESVSGGAAGSWLLSNLAPRMLSGDFEPGFFVDHFLKDMDIALAEARRSSLVLPGLALAHELYVSLRAHGGGRQGTQAVISALARLSNIDWREQAADPSA